MLVLLGSVKDVEKQTGIKDFNIRQWMNKDADFRALVEDFADTLHTQMKHELVGAAKDALKVTRGIMNDVMVEPAIRLKAAQDIMDRAGFSPKKHQQVDINSTINHFSSMPDDELDKIIDISFEEVVEDDGQTAKREDSTGETRKT